MELAQNFKVWAVKMHICIAIIAEKKTSKLQNKGWGLGIKGCGDLGKGT